MTILRGVRPVALTAVSERERLRAHPHRAQAAVNHVRALQNAAATPAPLTGESACPTKEEADPEIRPAKRKRR